MEEVERTNTMVVRELGQTMEIPPKRNPHTMEVDRGINCYACRGFGHMVYHYRNRRRDRVEQRRRLEYGRGRFEGNYKHLDNLKGVENLESLN